MSHRDRRYSRFDNNDYDDGNRHYHRHDHGDYHKHYERNNEKDGDENISKDDYKYLHSSHRHRDHGHHHHDVRDDNVSEYRSNDRDRRDSGKYGARSHRHDDMSSHKYSEYDEEEKERLRYKRERRHSERDDKREHHTDKNSSASHHNRSHVDTTIDEQTKRHKPRQQEEQDRDPIDEHNDNDYEADRRRRQRYYRSSHDDHHHHRHRYYDKDDRRIYHKDDDNVANSNAVTENRIKSNIICSSSEHEIALEQLQLKGSRRRNRSIENEKEVIHEHEPSSRDLELHEGQLAILRRHGQRQGRRRGGRVERQRRERERERKQQKTAGQDERWRRERQIRDQIAEHNRALPRFRPRVPVDFHCHICGLNHWTVECNRLREQADEYPMMDMRRGCWRCAQRGHNAAQCTVRKYKCAECGGMHDTKDCAFDHVGEEWHEFYDVLHRHSFYCKADDGQVQWQPPSHELDVILWYCPTCSSLIPHKYKECLKCHAPRPSLQQENVTSLESSEDDDDDDDDDDDSDSQSTMSSSSSSSSSSLFSSSSSSSHCNEPNAKKSNVEK